MVDDPEVHAFLLKHLQAIQENDLTAYHATTAEDLTSTNGGSRRTAWMDCHSMIL